MRSFGQNLTPGVADRYLAKRGFAAQYAPVPRDPTRATNLFAPVPGDHGARGAFDDRASDRDFFARATTRLGAAGVKAIAAFAIGAAVIGGARLARRARIALRHR